MTWVKKPKLFFKTEGACFIPRNVNNLGVLLSKFSKQKGVKSIRNIGKKARR